MGRGQRHLESAANTARVLRWLLAAGLAIRLGGWIAETGPVRLFCPATILSYTDAIGASGDRALLFLDELSRAAPPGASITVVEPAGRTFTAQVFYLLAVSRMPELRVVPPGSLGGPSPPAYVGALGGDLSDPRFVRAARLPHGTLYRRIR
jgi:hypothetical protein